MARLVDASGEVRPLPAGRRTVLGGPGADLVFDGLSGAACAFRPLKGGGLGLESLDPEHPVLVNGRPVKAVRLRDGDRLEIGSLTLRYEAGDEADLPPGIVLDGYRIEGVMGHGGMGTVYRATQLSLHREVALKVLNRRLSSDPDFVRRFVREARAAARFQHPNVVQVFDVSEHAGRPFYSMELLTEGTLEDELRAKGPLSWREALRVLEDAARGLAYAEELGILHRDLKPENLMRTPQGLTKICDLGLAVARGDDGGELPAGTPHFMSPEQIRRAPLDHRSDLYALGCTVFRLVTGKTPFTGASVKEILKAHLEAPVPSARALNSDVPEEFDRILQKLMAKEPEARFASAAELLAAVEELERAKAVRGPVRLLLAVAVVGVGLVAYLLSRGPEVRVEKVRERDPRLAGLERKARELKAKEAFLALPAGLAPLERARRLEALAKRFAGTETAARARAEAGRLRRAEKERAERERRERERLAALLAELRRASAPLAAAGRFAEALRKAAARAGRDPLGRRAIESLGAELLAAWRRRLAAARKDLRGALAKPAAARAPDDWDRLAARFEQEFALLAREAPPGGAAEAAALNQAAAKAAAALRARAAEARAALAAKLQAEREALLFGPEGLFALAAAGKPGEARAKLAARGERLPAAVRARLALLFQAEAPPPVRAFAQALARTLPALRRALAEAPPAGAAPELPRPPGGAWPELPPEAELPAALRPERRALAHLLAFLDAAARGADAEALSHARALEQADRPNLTALALDLGGG